MVEVGFPATGFWKHRARQYHSHPTDGTLEGRKSSQKKWFKHVERDCGLREAAFGSSGTDKRTKKHPDQQFTCHLQHHPDRAYLAMREKIGPTTSEIHLKH